MAATVEPSDKLALPDALDRVCERILSPMMLADLCKEMGISQSRFTRWVAADPVRSARVREARRLSAMAWAEMAEKVLQDAKDDFELKRAKELAHHYRWKASKADPGEFGEKIEVGKPGDFSKTEDDALLAQLNALVPGLGEMGRQILEKGGGSVH